MDEETEAVHNGSHSSAVSRAIEAGLIADEMLRAHVHEYEKGRGAPENEGNGNVESEAVDLYCRGLEQLCSGFRIASCRNHLKHLVAGDVGEGLRTNI
jgi:hypothetical protein